MKLKNFIFIDNDDQKDHMVGQSLKYATEFIKGCGVPEFDWSNHQTEFGWWKLDREKQVDILLGTPQNPKNDILVSWSMYTIGQIANSFMQMANMLKMFGNNYINDRMYLDTSGQIKNLITTILGSDIDKQQASVIRAIENNFIITLSDDRKPERLRINTQVRSYSDKWYKTEEVDFNDILYK